jgi:hypothetical protein
MNRRVAHLRTVTDAGPSSLEAKRRNGTIFMLGSTILYYQSQFNTIPTGLPKHVTLCNTYWRYVMRPPTSPPMTSGPMRFGPQGHMKWHLNLRVSARKVTCSDIWPYLSRPARSPVVTLNLNNCCCCAQCLFTRMARLIRCRIALRVQAGRANELHVTHNTTITKS